MSLHDFVAIAHPGGTQEPLDNLEGTSEEAILEYEKSHPDVPFFVCLQGKPIQDALAAAVDTFYREPSVGQFEAVCAAAAGIFPREQLYDSATRWLLAAGARADTEECASSALRSRCSEPHPSMRACVCSRDDLRFYRVLVELYSVHQDVHGPTALLQTILPLRPHSLIGAARCAARHRDKLLLGSSNPPSALLPSLVVRGRGGNSSLPAPHGQADTYKNGKKTDPL